MTAPTSDAALLAVSELPLPALREWLLAEAAADEARMRAKRKLAMQIARLVEAAETGGAMRRRAC